MRGRILLFCGIFILYPVILLAGSLPFSVGEKLRYTIHASGFYVGRQTIELKSIGEQRGIQVYNLSGISKTSPLVSIFYRLNDKWLVYMAKDTLLPLRIEKDMVEGKRKGYLIYEINHELKTVDIQNITKGTNKVVHSTHTVFDLFSLIYYFRSNPSRFDDIFTFDFLEPKSVSTVQFRNEGEVKIAVPKLSKNEMIPAQKLKQIGGAGIEIYTSMDELRLPLKLVVPSRLSKRKHVLIEFHIEKYSPGRLHENIPRMYKILRF